MKKGRVPKDIKPWAKVARKDGWRVEVAKGGHIAFIPPKGSGRRMTVSATPSDNRSRLNERSRLRKAGLDL